MYSDHQKAICYMPLFQFGRILSTYEHMTNHETRKALDAPPRKSINHEVQPC